MNTNSNHGRHLFFNVFLFELEIYCQTDFKNYFALNQLDIFANRVIYFWNTLPNLINNSNSVKKLSLNLIISEILLIKEIKKIFGITIGSISWKKMIDISILYKECTYSVQRFYFIKWIWEDSERKRCLRRHNK